MGTEYLAPGVYLEEFSFKPRPIRGVSQSTLDHLVLLAKELSGLQTIARPVCQRDPAFRFLFTGPNKQARLSAARVLARELRLGLYRIDLLRIVNKYIGETEKNLHRIFAAAEDSRAILFFDEADALFGKPSEVKDSHDRYANLEQRIEEFDGLTILATNGKEELARAFLRKFQFIIPIKPRRIRRTGKPGSRRPTNDKTNRKTNP